MKTLFLLMATTASLNVQAEAMFTCGGGHEVAIGRTAETVAISLDKHQYLIYVHTEYRATTVVDRHRTEFGTFTGEVPNFVFTPTAYVSDSTGSEVVTRPANPRPYRARLAPGLHDWIGLEKRPMKPLAPSDPGVGIAQCKQGVPVADENAAMLFSAARQKGLLAP